jgi:N-6 DNA Methylase
MAAATHEERLGALRSALDGWGYEDSISEHFPIWSPSSSHVLLHADYVAFTHPDQRDISTSAIVAQVVDTDADIRTRWAPAAAALGAPAVLAALPDRLVLWQTATEVSSASEVLSGPMTSPASLVSRMSSLTPDAVARAKSQGFHPTLFPLGLDVLNESRKQARTYLTEQVEHALTRLSPEQDTSRTDLTARLVIGALAILMIRDKSPGTSLAEVGPGVLIDVAQQRYSGYFDWLDRLSQSEWDSFGRLVADLGTNINFASLEPSMVSDVYEQALVTKFVRRKRGTFYTPPQLAHQILNVIPFEHLEPTKRTVLDPACGSGTMLLAAANRLSQLQSDPVDSSIWHRYLISHLRGYDDDALATEITKLCLLMSAMPIGNSWQVDTVDTLNIQLMPSDRPSIIVSNPPWQGQRHPERANVFLSWMLANLAPEGFLACVVPLSWINKEKSRKAREALLQDADLLEVWRLPASVFHSTASTIAPAVIVAQKHGKGHYHRHTSLVKTVRDRSTGTFLKSGHADESYLVEPASDGHRLTHGPLSRELSGLENFIPMEQANQVWIGRPQLSGRPKRSKHDATHYELGSLRHLRPFGMPKIEDLRPVRYPDDYNRSRASDEIVRAHKVVVDGKHFSADDPWRLTVGYDDHGLSLREMFFAVIPDPQWPPWSHLTEWLRYCTLMAILGSGLASCWMDENEPTRNISIQRIKSFPMPADAARIDMLADAGQAIAAAVISGTAKQLAHSATELEATVNRVYQLTPSARQLIADRLAGAPAPEGVVRYPDNHTVEPGTHNEDSDVPSFGHVLETAEDGLLVWISGVTEESGMRITPPLQIPGWLCREGSDFTVAGSLDRLGVARFGFHRSEWLSDNELTIPR